MSVRAKMTAGVARQLRRPGGIAGYLVGAVMDRRNRRTITAAVDALSPAAGTVVADIGFGGGAGLELLLDRVGVAGRVHGIEVSTAMLNRAARRFRSELADGRLALHTASLTDLPLPNSSLDGAITVNTIYFIADLERALSELTRTLKPARRAVIGVADPDWMRTLPTTEHGFRLRPLSAITHAAADAGLILDDHRHVGHGPYPYHLLVLRPTGEPP
jgi:SAM-dependent methyltransferase